MSLRMLEGVTKQGYYDVLERENIRPHDQILKNEWTGPQLAPFYRSLFSDLNNQTAVTRNQNVDGSVTPVRFELDVKPDEILIMSQLIFSIRDSGTLDSGGWGNNGGVPLTNGMRVGGIFNGCPVCFTPITWKSHIDLANISHELTHHNWGQGDEFLTMKFDIAASGTRFRLRGDKGDRFWMDVQDDLTHLVEQRCICQGIIENKYLS